MEKHTEITKEMLHQHFDYVEGVLLWKNPIKFSPVKPGTKAGRLVKNGYLQTCFNRKRLLNHQIIFKMFHGFIPMEIDHIDRNVLNNKIENLRQCTRSENLANRRKYAKTKE